MKNIISRRKTIQILASAIAMFPIPLRANKNIYHYHWNGIALGNPVEMKIFAKNKNHLEKIFFLVNSEIKRIDNIFYLQNASSNINQLNQNKVLVNAERELINAIYLSEKFYKFSKGSYDITIQPLWNKYSSGKKVILDGINFNNIDISKQKIRLLNNYTEITLNSLAQGILTDRIHEILLNSGIENHLINFGEGRASGISPNKNKWDLNVNNNIIDITNKGYSVSEANSTTLPNNMNHLFNANIKASAINIPSKTTVIAKTATLADALSTTYAVSNNLIRSELIKNFTEVQFIIND